MHEKLFYRLRASRGETLVEVLCAMLIATLALVVLANTISRASHLVIRSEEVMEEYYDVTYRVTSLDGARTFYFSLKDDNNNAGFVLSDDIGISVDKVTEDFINEHITCYERNWSS